METVPTFSARILREGKWFIAFSPELPEGNGQGETKEKALESLRQTILLLIEDIFFPEFDANLGSFGWRFQPFF